MKMLKSKATIALIIMILGISYIGGVENNLEDNNQNYDQQVSVNA